MKTTDKYSKYCKPLAGHLMNLISMSKIYERGEGDLLFYKDDEGNEVSVIDFIGGCGASLFGHNHPELVKEAKKFLDNKQVFNAQASCRSKAAELGEKLSNILEKSTGETFVATFANSGTEATEAAIKHANMTQLMKIEAIMGKLKTKVAHVRKKIQKEELNLADIEGYELIKNEMNANLDDDTTLTMYFLGTFQEFSKDLPKYMALENSCHGRAASSALHLNHNELLKQPFMGIGCDSIFVKHDLEAIRNKFKSNLIEYVDISIRGDEVKFEKRQISKVVAFFIEPIQGEGGIHEISNEFATGLKEITSEYSIPLVIDEIQTGMGRTGTFFASDKYDISGDYYLLSKSLGGGLSKISALLINSKQYIDIFSVIHTSTFAEDDFSSSIALKAISILEKNSLTEDCQTKGTALKNKLLAVKEKYPKIIHDIRGSGLMLGIHFDIAEEFTTRTISSLRDQNLLAHSLSAFLLHEFNLRVAPTLSETAVLKIEPSVFIKDEHVDKLIEGLSFLCEVIRCKNSYEFLRPVVSKNYKKGTRKITDYYNPSDKNTYKPDPNRTKIGFVGHLLVPGDIVLWEKCYENFTEDEKRYFIDKFQDLISPSTFEPITLKSKTGKEIDFYFYGLLYDAHSFASMLKTNEISVIHKKIFVAVNKAKDIGCKMFGLGAFTSIITMNGQLIRSPEIGITSGNSLTVAISLQGLEQRGTELGILPKDSVCAVIGSTGNIGSVYSEIIARKVKQVYLFCRKGREGALTPLLERTYKYFIDQIISNKSDSSVELCPIANSIKDLKTVQFAIDNGYDFKNFIKSLKEELNGNCPLVVSSNLKDDLKNAQLILAATSQPHPLIFPEMLGKGPILINDVSVPQDTDTSVMEARDDVNVMMGGIVTTETGGNTNLPGLPLDSGEFFACMGETMVLGMEDYNDNFSYGDITVEHIEKITELAEKHGVRLSRIKETSLVDAMELLKKTA